MTGVTMVPGRQAALQSYGTPTYRPAPCRTYPASQRRPSRLSSLCSANLSEPPCISPMASSSRLDCREGEPAAHRLSQWQAVRHPPPSGLRGTEGQHKLAPSLAMQTMTLWVPAHLDAHAIQRHDAVVVAVPQQPRLLPEQLGAHAGRQLNHLMGCHCREVGEANINTVAGNRPGTELLPRGCRLEGGGLLTSTLLCPKTCADSLHSGTVSPLSQAASWCTLSAMKWPCSWAK